MSEIKIDLNRDSDRELFWQDGDARPIVELDTLRFKSGNDVREAVASASPDAILYWMEPGSVWIKFPDRETMAAWLADHDSDRECENIAGLPVAIGGGE